MSQLEDLKAAVNGIPDLIMNQASTQQAAETWEQTYVSFVSLMTGSNNPRIESIRAFMAESRDMAFYFEGRESQLRVMIEELAGSM